MEVAPCSRAGEPRYCAPLPFVQDVAKYRRARGHHPHHALAAAPATSALTLPVVCVLLGPTDAATTARYAHLVESSRKRAAGAVSSAIAAALAGHSLRTPDDPNAQGAKGATILPFELRA